MLHSIGHFNKFNENNMKFKKMKEIIYNFTSMS